MRQTIKTRIILLVAIVLALLIWGEYNQITTAQTKAIIQSPQVTNPTEAENEDKLAQALRLALQSTQALDDSYAGLVRSILLAAESMRRLPTVEGNIALRQGLSLLLRPNIQLNLGANVSIGAFSPDLHWLATGSEGGIVQIWDATTGQAIVEMRHEDRWIWAITFSSDGKWVATGSSDKTARIWDVNTGHQILRVNHDHNVNAVAFSSDGKWLATGSADNTARIWEIKTGREIAQFLHEDSVTSVAFSPDGKWLATGSVDNNARIWDIVTGSELKRIAHYGSVEFVGFNAEGKWLVTANSSTVQVWDIASSGIVTLIQEAGLELVTISPDGQWLATGNYDGLFRIWETSTGKEVGRTFQLGSLSSISLAFSTDGQQLGTGNFYGPVAIWQIEPLPGLSLKSDTDTAVNKVIFSPDSRLLAARPEDNTTRLWAINNKQEVGIIQQQGQINDFTFSPDSQWLATASIDNTVQVLNLTVTDQPFQLKHDGPVNRVAFSADGRWLATASNDGTARIWETKTGKEMVRVEHDTSVGNDGVEKAWPINAVEFSPDSKKLATGNGDSTARIWDVTTGNELVRFDHAPFIESFEVQSQTHTVTYTWSVNDVDFSSNGRWLMANSFFSYATGTSEQARIWDITTQQEISGSAIATFSPDGNKVALYNWSSLGVSEMSLKPKVLWSQDLNGRQNITFSPDGKFLATGRWNPRYNEGDAYVWDALTGQEIAFLPHPGQVLQVAFSPDSQWVATFSTGAIGPNYEGGGVRVWDAKTGREIIYLDEGGNVAFSPDGRWLAAGSGNGSIHLLYLQPEDLLAEACSRLPRNLTKQEWRQYLGNEPYQATCPNLPIPEN